MIETRRKINSAQHYFAPEDIDYITAQVPHILRTRLTQGQRVKAFEEAARAAIGARYAVAANTCTSALEMTMRAPSNALTRCPCVRRVRKI